MFVTEFVDKVRSMRENQKAYFKDRTNYRALAAAKELEKAVDKALAEGVTLYATPEPTAEEQLALFERMKELNEQEPTDAGDLGA